jgi:molybdopterin-guanine dinucleotide biosynthesis protein B
MKVYGIIGWKNAGKTSLMERLVAEITARGLTVSTVKHVHHDVDLDQPGKDTFRHRAAGAREVVLASAKRHAILTEHRDGPEPELAAILARLAPVDLVLIEGYKRDSHAKIEVWRPETGQALIQPGDPYVRAVATDAALPQPVPVPVLDLNDTGAVADFILRETGLISDPVARFDTVVVVDWSAAGSPSPREPSPDAIWIGIAGIEGERTSYHRTRAEAEVALNALFDAEAAAGRRVLAGFDFAFGYPEGFTPRLTGLASVRALWDWLAENLADNAENANDRFALADRINARLGGKGPFWGNGLKTDFPHLPRRMEVDFDALGFSRRRRVEGRVRSAQEAWKLSGAGSVGGQVLTGLPLIARLAGRRGCAVWPFEAPTGNLVLAEVYPSLLAAEVNAELTTITPLPDGKKPIKDREQVRLLARALFRLARNGGLLALLADIPDWSGRQEEGWMLGAGHEPALKAALR